MGDIQCLTDIPILKAEIWHGFGTAMRMTWKYVYGIFIVSVSRLIRIKNVAVIYKKWTYRTGSGFLCCRLWPARLTFMPGREPVPGNLRKVLRKRRQTCVIGMEKINLLNVRMHSL